MFRFGFDRGGESKSGEKWHGRDERVPATWLPTLHQVGRNAPQGM